ncbi:hypothetical protein [Saccharopolyspora sp. 5N708]|uniref:hypothetical protein n=1 Tax=Saccharopolyspora sp. 5N708 TaxID=3457424 RepID=UPI003FD59898
MRQRTLPSTSINAAFDGFDLPISLFDLRSAPTDLIAGPAASWGKAARAPSAISRGVRPSSQRRPPFSGVVDKLRDDIESSTG